MIARAKQQPTNRLALLGADGNPYRKAKASVDMRSLVHRPLRGRYDAAQELDSMRRYWASADVLSADAANARDVRCKLVSRSRYEFDNNPYYSGIIKTHTNYLVGTGPVLRMQTGNEGFNNTIEALFKQWLAAIGFHAKLQCMSQAKTRDGEGIGIVGTNPRVRHRVKLDVLLVETEQCQSPQLMGNEPGYVDGIAFDSFSNPLWYDILPAHPGAGTYQSVLQDPVRVPAEYVLHWFRADRPGQHRGIPELTSSLNCGAAFRRLRDSTLMANELAADFAVLLHTTLPPDDGEFATPFSTADVNKGMITAMPQGYAAEQLDAKHPNSTYEMFHKANVSEQARPLNMPYNVAACDSSSYNYASGRLDHQTYFSSLDVERVGCEWQVLDKLFGLWWAEARMVYDGWSAGEDVPAHTWDHPQHPVADVRAEAIANNFKLRNGSAGLSQIYADQGYDAEEQMAAEAALLGVELLEYKRRVFNALFPETQTPADQAASDADREELQNALEEEASRS